MTHLDELEASIIASARRAMAPTVSVEERVRMSTVGAVAAGAVVADLGPGLGERLSTVAADALESMTEASTQARVLLGVAALSAVGAGGYGLGFRAGRAQAARAEAGRVIHRPAATTVVPQLDNAIAEPPRQPDTAPTSPPQAAKRTSSWVARPAPNVEAQALPVEPHVADPEEEVRTLRRVERVLREHNPRFALALLSDLDRSVPQGKLMEEREAARTVATCELEGATPAAGEQAAAYAARFPGSVYAPRVQQACGVK